MLYLEEGDGRRILLPHEEATLGYVSRVTIPDPS
jgi:hypothetical protein